MDDLIGLEGIEDFIIRLRDPNMLGVQVDNNATFVNIVDDDGVFLFALRIDIVQLNPL